MSKKKFFVPIRVKVNFFCPLVINRGNRKTR